MKIRDLSLCGLFSALLAVCSFISFPLGPVSFTLQSFGVFFALYVLGGKWGTISILVYLCLGALGIPVFSGFQGGIHILLGPSGGFLFGFLLTGLLFWVTNGAWHSHRTLRLLITACGLILCYLAGFLWLGQYVGNITSWLLTFFLPDCGKIALAWYLSGKIKR